MTRNPWVIPSQMRTLRIHGRAARSAPRQCTSVNASPHVRPLFIALKTQFFLEFERGEKSIEYRRHGGRWTAQRCFVGRAVVLSHGYSGRRLQAIVTAFETRIMDSETYGPQQLLALIHVQLVDAVTVI